VDSPQGPLVAEVAQDLAHEPDERRIGHARDLVALAHVPDEGAADVERGPDADLADDAREARGHEGAPDDRGEAEPARLGAAHLHLARRVEVDAPEGEHVGRAAHAGERRGAGLVDVEAARGGDDGGAAGDVDRLQRVHADACDAQGRLGGANDVREGAAPLVLEGLDDARQLVARLALGAKRGDEGALLELWLLVAPDLAVGLARLFPGEALTALEPDHEATEAAELVFVDHSGLVSPSPSEQNEPPPYIRTPTADPRKCGRRGPDAP
jgi:hypothetical protein